MIGYAIGFSVGFFKQDLRFTIGISAICVIIALVVCVPAWPMYKRNPMKWQPSSAKKAAAVGEGTEKEGKAEDQSPSTKENKNKKD